MQTDKKVGLLKFNVFFSKIYFQSRLSCLAVWFHDIKIDKYLSPHRAAKFVSELHFCYILQRVYDLFWYNKVIM